MEDALPRFRPDIAHDPVAAQPKLPCNLPQRAEEGGQQVAVPAHDIAARFAAINQDKDEHGFV